MKTLEQFYVDFENQFRGSREEIFEKQKFYLPLVTALKEIYPGHQAIDIGCGRGEWLELLNSQDWPGLGLDINAHMTKICTDLGYKAICCDGIDYLKSLPDNSVPMISAFHVVEHVYFADLFQLIKEAHRVLLPGGIFIAETPNPENIHVGSCSFYMDPTHKNPIPPLQLSFTAEHIGFKYQDIARINAPPHYKIENPNYDNLYKLLIAPPDYGLVAQKTVDEKTKSLDGLFKATLSTKHDQEYVPIGMLPIILDNIEKNNITVSNRIINLAKRIVGKFKQPSKVKN